MLDGTAEHNKVVNRESTRTGNGWEMGGGGINDATLTRRRLGRKKRDGLEI